MKYILVALQQELEGIEFDPTEARVVYTGVGKINAAMSTVIACAATDCTEIINYGTAGVLNKDLIGKLNKIGVVRQRDMDARPLSELGVTPFEEDSNYCGDIKISNAKAVLSTGDNFVTDMPELESDLVDMEGYAIAKIAKRFGKTLTIVKYGSDFADSDAGDDWEQNVAKGAELFKEWFDNR